MRPKLVFVLRKNDVLLNNSVKPTWFACVKITFSNVSERVHRGVSAEQRGVKGFKLHIYCKGEKTFSFFMLD